MSYSIRWLRASKADPCPICEHPDWCSTSADGSVAICMRVSEGSIKRTRNGGFLHRLRETHRPRDRNTTTAFVRDSTPSRNDLPILARNYQTAVNPARLDQLAKCLGLSVASLQRLGIGWAFGRGAWTFPMTNAADQVIGIRLRFESGRKSAVLGGREGLFIPNGLGDSIERLIVTEGPTDCAALLDLGFQAVGRPSCTGGIGHLIAFVRQRKPDEVVILSDADEPGQRGAEALAEALITYTPRLRLLSPPAGIKDAREWRRAGATAGDVLGAVGTAPMIRVQIAARISGGIEVPNEN